MANAKHKTQEFPEQNNSHVAVHWLNCGST